MKQYRKLFLFLIPIIIYLILILYSDAQKIINNIDHLKISLFLVFVGFWSLAVIIRVIRWHIFMKYVSDLIPFVKNVFYYLSGYSMLISPGRIGEVIKSPYIKRDYGISISKTAAVVFVERFYDTLASITIISVAISFTTLPKTILVIPTSIIAIMIAIMTNKKLFTKITMRLGKIKIIGNIIPNADESFEVIFGLIKSKFFFIGTGLTLCVVFCEAVSVYYLLESLGSKLDFATLAAVFHISNFLAAASMLPGGLGILEGGFSGLLILYHIPKDISFSAAVLIRIIATGLFSIIGLAFLRIVSK